MKLTFLGDLMCTGDMLNKHIVSDRYDFTSIFNPVKSMLSKSDYVFANLETPISPTNSDLTHERYSFCSPIEFAQAVKNAGIDFVSTANNHCLDRGIIGLENTIIALDKIGLQHTGTFAQPHKSLPSIINISGLKIGVLAYTYGTNAFANHNYLRGSECRCVNMTQNQELSHKIGRWCYNHRGNIFARIYNKISETFCPGQLSGPIYERRERSLRCLRKIRRDLKYLKENSVDMNIMLLHLGGQYNHAPLGSAKSLVSRILSWEGVDIVSGTHEHVVHNGIYNRIHSNQIATYSLGNFNSTAGTFTPPFNQFVEYSVAWHIYIDEKEKKILRSAFTILKNVADKEGKMSTVVCHDILNDCGGGSLKVESNSKQQLLCDMQTVAFRFTGRRYTIEELTRQPELPIE